MNEAILAGLIMAAPALIAAVFNYYKNKASITATYEGIASRCAKELERQIEKYKIKKQEMAQLQDELDRALEEIKRLKRGN